LELQLRVLQALLQQVLLVLDVLQVLQQQVPLAQQQVPLVLHQLFSLLFCHKQREIKQQVLVIELLITFFSPKIYS
jgi:hypothetical protein